ncbi:uncharacterized protein EI90DRAFT_590325 [Cantharellus anzutake]|uniref:uncharacterized protein n=1 Tax=Cantharellus anzutake TaxID=1750568 RepID=UPI0019089A8C|nr:uncharacterized protein EI90DRAFT_590325 [Cantharellus anzutake]KAF8333647.1 hypothetical protein EI90DRAFT_590325 [Cantharellus anzutake]
MVLTQSISLCEFRAATGFAYTVLLPPAVTAEGWVQNVTNFRKHMKCTQTCSLLNVCSQRLSARSRNASKKHVERTKVQSILAIPKISC